MADDRQARRREQYQRFRFPTLFAAETGRERRRNATVQRQRAARQERIAQARRTNPQSMHAAFDQQAHQAMLGNPLYRQLAQEASHGGTIRVVTRDDQPRPGLWRGHTRELSMQSTLTGPDRASVMAFELTNAVHSSASDRLVDRAIHGQIDREGFARQREFLEYEGVQRHHQIMAHGISQLGWPASMDRFGAHFSDRFMDIDPPATPARGDWRTFEGYWQTQNRARPGQPSHADLHRQSYDATQRIRTMRRGFLGFAPGNHPLDQGPRGPQGGGGGSSSAV